MGSSSAASVVRGSHPGGDAEDGQVLDELPSLHRSSPLPPRGQEETILPAPARSERRRHASSSRLPRARRCSPRPSRPRAGSAPRRRPPRSPAEAVAAELDAYLWKHVLKPRFPAVRRQGARRLPRRTTRATGPRSRTARASSSTRRGSSGRPRPWPACARRPATSTCRYVRHGVRYLADVMWDREHGGFHTLRGPRGPRAHGPSSPSRPVYGQAFAIYGLAAAHAATGDAEPLELAKRALALGRGPLPRRPRPRLPQRGEADGQPFPLPKDEARRARLDRGARAPPHDERPHPPARGVRGAAALLAGPGAAEEDGGAARLRARPALRRAGLPLHRPLARRSRRARARSRSATTWRRPS